ncbi:MAG: hypothetical protein ABSB49_15585 [Polyangia bacterium]|jgi:hypothetical protein
MREKEMRRRVERFLQTRLRRMLAPATLGLGLAMAGCPSGGSSGTNDASGMVSGDASGADAYQVAPMYMASIPDAAREAPMPQPDYMAQMPDAGPDGGVVLRYMAPMPDASSDERAVARYMAQMPDATRDELIPVAVPAYMAPVPPA